MMVDTASQLDRRAFMKLGGAAMASLVIPQWAWGDENLISEKKLSFYNIHTGEKCSSVFWAEGEYIPEGIAEINKILRDHRTGDVAQMDIEVFELLYNLQKKMDAKGTFNVISGFRSQKTNAMLNKTTNGVAKKSMHTLGKAIDINLPGHKLAMLRKAAIDAKTGGVGYYPSSNFVHVDVGRVRQW